MREIAKNIPVKKDVAGSVKSDSHERQKEKLMYIDWYSPTA
jgi:hypothetical protein